MTALSSARLRAGGGGPEVSGAELRSFKIRRRAHVLYKNTSIRTTKAEMRSEYQYRSEKRRISSGSWRFLIVSPIFFNMSPPNFMTRHLRLLRRGSKRSCATEFLSQARVRDRYVSRWKGAAASRTTGQDA